MSTKENSNALIKSDDAIIELINKYGARYVVRNYLLSHELIRRIAEGHFCSIDEDEYMDEHEIKMYQKFFLSINKKPKN